MFNRYTLIILAVLAILAVLLLLHTGDEDVILAQLELLREQAEISAPESGIEQLAKANTIAGLFSEATIFDLGSAGYGTTAIASRQELVRQVIALRARLASLELDLQEAEVHIDRDTAQVQVTGSGLGSLTGQQEQFLEIHSGIITLAKENGDWLITGARHLQDERQAGQQAGFPLSFQSPNHREIP